MCHYVALELIVLFARIFNSNKYNTCELQKNCLVVLLIIETDYNLYLFVLNQTFPIRIRTRIFSLITAVDCPATMVYSECSSACPKDCSRIKSESNKCTSDCVDGCACPPGKWLDQGKCVDKAQCSCWHNDISYSHRSIRTEECQQW